MKYIILFLSILILSCSNSDQSSLAETEAEFAKTAKQFHNLYITAGDCDESNSMVHEGILFYENGRQFTYQNILEYCAYGKPKQPYETFSKQYLIKPDVGFDYVDQYYVNSEQDTLREVSSRIWEKNSNGWVVTYMQVNRQIVTTNQ